MRPRPLPRNTAGPESEEKDMDKLTEAIAKYNAHTAECRYCEPSADWTKNRLCWRGQNAFGVIRFESAAK